jgi:hypothetical protein
MADHPRAAELAEQALAVYRELGDRSGEDRVLHKHPQRQERLAQQERARLAATAGRQTARAAAGPYRRRVVELGEKVGSSFRGGASASAALAQALSGLREGSGAKRARSAFQIGVLCRNQGDIDHAILALDLCVDVMKAIGWGPDTAAAALGLPQEETLADELARLRASRTK